MFWKRKQKPDDDKRQSVAAEISRRAKSLLRQQLELLRIEGSIDSDSLKRILYRQGRLVDQDDPHLVRPAFEVVTSRATRTYLEGAQTIFRTVAMDLLPTEQSLAALDPLGVGYFDHTTADALLEDVLLSAYVIRNQSLHATFGEDAAIAIHARTAAAAVDALGKDRLSAFLRLNRAWAVALVRDEPPHLALAVEVIGASVERRRRHTVLTENPLLEIAVADTLVHAGLNSWQVFASIYDLVPECGAADTMLALIF